MVMAPLIRPICEFETITALIWIFRKSSGSLATAASTKRKGLRRLSAVAGVLVVLPMYRPRKPESRWRLFQ
jgi:hypothetical protein